MIKRGMRHCYQFVFEKEARGKKVAVEDGRMVVQRPSSSTNRDFGFNEDTNFSLPRMPMD